MTKKPADRHYGGSNDPARSLKLLWRNADPHTDPDTDAPRGRGPKPGLTVDRIVRVAIELADAEGLAALSMRRVADRLGVGTMSLYTYVPAKGELVDLMFDAVAGEAPRPEHQGDWRARLTAVAMRNWAGYLRHPWMLQVMAMARPPLGPNSIANYDYDLRAVDGVGLSELAMDSVISLVSVYVQGAARAAVEAASSERDTGLTDEQWWAAHGPILERVFDAERYPVAARVGAIAGETYQAAYDPEHGFRFGLDRILDGIEVLINRHA